jgi:hypothetical protein
MIPLDIFSWTSHAILNLFKNGPKIIHEVFELFPVPEMSRYLLTLIYIMINYIYNYIKK